MLSSLLTVKVNYRNNACGKNIPVYYRNRLLNYDCVFSLFQNQLTYYTKKQGDIFILKNALHGTNTTIYYQCHKIRLNRTPTCRIWK